MTLPDELRNEIESAYSSEGRHYHNLAHIEYMMRLFETHRDSLNDPESVELAILYHDVIYDPTRDDNEEQSAQLAASRLSEIGATAERIEKVKHMILATKSHEDPGDNDTRYLIDFDLAILGENPATYQEYTKNIREEYQSVPERMYKRGRMRVLRSFLDREHIYHTPEFRESREEQARLNLGNELRRLSNLQ